MSALLRSTLGLIQIALIVLSWLIQYTYGMVLGTITVLEDPTIESDSAHRERRVHIRTVDSLYATIQRLRTHLGRWFYLRGFFVFLLHDMIKNIILPFLLPMHSVTPLQDKLSSAIYAAILANLQVVWVQIVVTKPSPKFFYQRLPKFSDWIRVAPLPFLEVLARWLIFSTAVFLEAELLKITGIADIEQDMFEPGGTQLDEKAQGGLKISMLCIFPKLMEALVAFPARAAFIRMAASMLPDDDEPVVPLDPKVRENALLGILDAWKSFHMVAYVRFRSVQVAAFVMGVAVFMLGSAMSFNFNRHATFPILWFNS